MYSKEIKEIYELFERSCLNPKLCDSPVEYSDCGVKAGLPSDPGDIVKDYLLLPRELVGAHPVFVIDVIGDSMTDAGIVEGDRLQVEIGARVDDGDIVVASINGECTVKAYCRDEREQCWLVPRNESYDAIMLSEDMDFRIIGKVVGHMKGCPRSSYSEMLKTIRRTRGKDGRKMKLSDEKISMLLDGISDNVEHGRQWYAVYRAMVDRGVIDEGDYVDFVSKVCAAVPEHGHLPVASELRRMAVLSFRKPVSLWERGNAPVSGSRFDEYLRIAKITLDKF